VTTHHFLETDRPASEPVSEELLLAAVRDGSDGAIAILYARHRGAALRLAERTLSPAESWLAEDVVETAFLDVVRALRNGNGPTDALGAYLTTAVRREAWRTLRHRERETTSAVRLADGRSAAVLGPIEECTSPAVEVHVLLREAFMSLPDSWRQVLWLTEVDGHKPAEAALLLGTSPAATASLAYRARRGLVSAYVGAYLLRHDGLACHAIADRLADYLAAARRVDSQGDGFVDVVAHLDACDQCRDLSRGVDLGASALAGLGPLALVLAIRTAAAPGAGVSSEVGTAVDAGAAGTMDGSLTSGGAGTTGSGPVASPAAGTSAGVGTGAGVSAGVGLGPGAAVAAVVGVVVGAVALGAVLVGDGADRVSLSAPADLLEVSIERPGQGGRGAEGAGEPSVPPLTPTTVWAPALRPAPDGEAAPAVPAVLPLPAEAAQPVRPPVDATTTHPPSTAVPPTVPSPTTVPRPTIVQPPTTSIPATASTTSTTSVPAPVPEGGRVSGRVVLVDQPDADEPAPHGVIVRAVAVFGGHEHHGAATPSGAWEVRGLEPGWYLVTAEVPSRYAPAQGGDPWSGGATWRAMLGLVLVDRGAAHLDDLRLVRR
jgi:RNA polymerase sigma factor (sigma-70 family)